MKSGFKYIVIGIIVSLSIIFLFQLFWLKGLYDSMETEVEKAVMECLEMADMDELQFRVDSLERSPNAETTISVSQSYESREESPETKEKVLNKQVVQGEDTVFASRDTEQSSPDIREMEQLFKTIREVVHQTIDSIAPVNLGITAQSLMANFELKGIKSKLYRIEVVNFNTDSIVQQADVNTNFGWSQPFTYVYDSQNQLGYRIRMESLTKTVLQQMAGILITTVLIIVILGFAFRYLIRTVMRQKTMEEMKDDFTNNMTHELKTPIAVAYSAADALLNFKQGDNKEKRDKYLTICKEQLSELSGLVEQILSMSMERRRTFVLNKEEIRIADMVNNLMAHHRLKSDKPVVFTTRIDPEDPVVYADRTHLNNMLSNLIDNAVKYSGDEVCIDVVVYQRDKYTVMEVKDNGIGIPPEKQPYVFDKFYRVTHGNRYEVKGYGLGLFYVKTMAEKHGGTVTVAGSPGTGSVFTIKIPTA